jgi:hypothetical protein
MAKTTRMAIMRRPDTRSTRLTAAAKQRHTGEGTEVHEVKCGNRTKTHR